MPADVTTIEQVRSMAATLPDDAVDDLRELQTIPEVLAYLVHVARAEGWDEVELVEIIAAAALSRDELRKARDVLKRLGYVAVATMLGELARKSKPNRSSKPVPKRDKR